MIYFLGTIYHRPTTMRNPLRKKWYGYEQKIQNTLKSITTKYMFGHTSFKGRTIMTGTGRAGDTPRSHSLFITHYYEAHV